MSGKSLGIGLVALIIIGGIVWYFASPVREPVTQEMATTTESASSSPSTGTSINPQSQDVTVTYSNSGFSPKSVSIPEGATVTFVNQSSGQLWVASDPHPVHNGYDGTSRSEHCAAGYSGALPFDACKNVAPGESWSFTFDKVGSWGYHNHSNEGMTGTVLVTQPIEGGPGVHATTSTSVSL